MYQHLKKLTTSVFIVCFLLLLISSSCKKSSQDIDLLDGEWSLSIHSDDLTGEEFIYFMPDGTVRICDSLSYCNCVDKLKVSIIGKICAEGNWEVLNDSLFLSLGDNKIDLDRSSFKVTSINQDVNKYKFQLLYDTMRNEFSSEIYGYLETLFSSRCNRRLNIGKINVVNRQEIILQTAEGCRMLLRK